MLDAILWLKFISELFPSLQHGRRRFAGRQASASVIVERKSGSQIGLALTVLALVLASNSIINESWLTQSDTVGDNTVTADISLSESSIEICDGNDCEKETEDLDSAYDDCMDMMEDASSSDKDEACGDIAKFHNSGLVATILLIIASVLLFVSTIFQVRSMTGHSSRLANIFSGISGFWVAVTILIWYLMLPDFDSDPDWGQGLWMVTIAATCALVAGFSGVLQSWIDGPSRMRAHGVRSGTEMKEFVLKESSCGDKALSILVDSDLIRVARISRIGQARP